MYTCVDMYIYMYIYVFVDLYIERERERITNKLVSMKTTESPMLLLMPTTQRPTLMTCLRVSPSSSVVRH